MNKIVIVGRVPSKKNSKRRVRRGSHIFMIPSQQHEDWHADAMAQLKLQKIPQESLEKVNKVTMMFWPPDKMRADLSNKAESVLDLLTDYGFWKDDNWFVVPILKLKLRGVDKENPRVEIMVY